MPSRRASNTHDSTSERPVDAVSWQDWQRLDEWERQQGEERGKLRHKLASVEELMGVIAELRGK